MNNLVESAVLQFLNLVRDSDCEEGIVRLSVNPETVLCQFERGACMEAEYGGKIAQFVTNNPVRAATKIGFLVGATLDTPVKKSAACAIMNVVTAFFCTSRRVCACPKTCHHPCKDALIREYKGKAVYVSGGRHIPGLSLASAGSADILLLNGDDLTEGIPFTRPEQTVIFIGPSASGVASLTCSARWCPYGSG